MTQHQSLAQLAALAAETEDQTETTSGGDFEYSPPEAGVTIGRFIEYIELGKQKQKPWQGKEKPPADEIRVTFELLHPKKNIKTIQVEGEDRTVAEYISIKMAKKLGEKAKFKKLFEKMRYGRADVKHIAQMLGEPFILTIVHNTVEKDGKKTVYANLDKDGEFGIGAPFITDPLEGTKTPVPVPPAIRPLKLFLFDHATKDTWDSLFIDGTREVKSADGSVTQVSKNWVQEYVLGATNFRGSALDQLLSGVGDLPISEPSVTEPAPASEPSKGPVVESGSVLPMVDPKPAQTPAASSGTASADALAALGLVA